MDEKQSLKRELMFVSNRLLKLIKRYPTGDALLALPDFDRQGLKAMKACQMYLSDVAGRIPWDMDTFEIQP